MPWHPPLKLGHSWVITSNRKKNMASFNSLAPGIFQFNFRYVIFKLTLLNGGWGISYEIVLRWMPLDLTDDELTLVQVMAWCRQATSHYLSQCWPWSLLPYGVTRPQWVNYGTCWPSTTLLKMAVKGTCDIAPRRASARVNMWYLQLRSCFYVCGHPIRDGVTV